MCVSDLMSIRCKIDCEKIGVMGVIFMRILVIPDIHLKPHIYTRAKELINKGFADTFVVSTK